MTKKKLLFFEEETNIVCDNEDCDFETNFKLPMDDMEDFIDTPCPKCRENLLTEEDYNGYARTVKFFRWVNKRFGWMGRKAPTKNYKTFEVNFHKELTIKEKKS